MDMGTRIADLRQKKGLTQAELAKRIGVNKSTIAFWEQGRGKPYPQNIQTLADFFGVTPAYLTVGDTTPKPEPIETVKLSQPPVAAKKYKASDKRKLDDLELVIKHLPDMHMSRDEQKSVYITLAEIRDEYAMKVLFGEDSVN